MADPLTFRYRFEMSDGQVHALDVELDPGTLQDLTPLPADSPAWTKLEFHQCPNCPFDPATTPLCPTAARLAPMVSAFSQTVSHDPATVRVHTPEREFSTRTEAQSGLSSLLGLKMAASGCPILARLRPMARFHLPFATELETAFRAVATYLVGQLLEEQAGGRADWTLDGLREVYRAVGEVNVAFAKRLRAAAPADANLNALVLLDYFAQVVPGSLQARLDRLRPVFEAAKAPKR